MVIDTAPGVLELAVLGGKLPVLGGALPVLSVWVFASFFVKVTQFSVDVSRCKRVWWRLFHPETLHECFDRHWLITWSDERQLKHNLFFLTNFLRSSTGVAFNTVESEILWLSLQTQHEVSQTVTENYWHLNDGFYYHDLTHLIYHSNFLNLWALLCFL